MKDGKNGPYISHLMFVNDLFLFGEAKESQFDVVIDCFEKFCNMLGHKVNQAKSYMFFSRNAKKEDKKSLASKRGFFVTLDLGLYLGIPLLHKRVSRHNYLHIIKKVEYKLAGWKK